MDEYIDIINLQGKPTGESVLKSVIHQKGYYHNTVHVWFYTSCGDILLSQRSAKKDVCPLLWDVSVAGHVDTGETIKQAAVRETKEEIGLKISKKDLNKIGVFECFQTYKNGIIDNEFHHTFISELKTPLSQLTPQVEEVEALKLVSIIEFKQLIKNIGINNHFVASNKSYYEIVLRNILSIVKF
ncbi:NUDIX domain-containing protein [uncultured Wocania sp.]|uniref:NUDIX hydrolase n=1 Tax=uncultured Wocania sp. TaxID=2834404 RepID=UPI0030F8B8FE